MKWQTTILIAAVFTTLAFCQTNSRVADKSSGQNQRKSFAVLELFTSEGCSSCPPADRLLQEFIKDSNIIALSFHVDYWDNLGWRDSFSNASFTERQRRYAEQFHLESIYTPQLIINGQYELVGSNRQKAESFIKSAEERASIAGIKINAVKNQNQHLEISCLLDGDIKNSLLLTALVQKHAERKIKAGENRGATLTHTNIVRSFVENDAKPAMLFNIPFPAELKNGEWQLALYLQNTSDLKITAGASYQ